MNSLASNQCPLCTAPSFHPFFELLDVPILCNILWTNRDSALQSPKGSIRLAHCSSCGFIANVLFQPDLVKYTSTYDNTLHFSSRFQKYAQHLAVQLINRYDLRNKDIVEIGCGQGDFLSLICNLGENRGIGFDPAYVERQTDVGFQVTFISDYFSERYQKYSANLIVCRQTLEHVFNPKDFLTMLRRVIGNHYNTVLFFEVPNAINIFNNLFIWDLIYEHYSYFTPYSLSYLFSLCGFKVCDLLPMFGNQYLGIHALPNDRAAPPIPNQHYMKNDFSKNIASFSVNYQNKIERLKNKLKQMERENIRIVIWGAGSKGVTFLNTYKKAININYVVDINPQKQGMYISGTGQRIVPPGFLRKYQPNIIIIMNALYQNEIEQHTQKLGLTTKFVCV